MWAVIAILSIIVLPSTALAGVLRINVSDYTHVLWPRDNGMFVAMQPLSGTYPSRDHFAQMVIVLSPDSSALIAAHDPAPTHRQVWELVNNDATAPCVVGGWCLRITFTSPTDPLLSVTAYPIANWKVPATEYKAWAQKQSWYRGHGKLADGQLGHIINAATTHYSYYRDNLAPAIGAFPLQRVGVYMTQYRVEPFDAGYPYYVCRQTADCPTWLQSVKNAGGFTLPYINGILWDSNWPPYNPVEMCQDATGQPTRYGTSSLRYVDPLLASWPQRLYDAFSGILAADGSTSEGVYLDVLTAVNRACYYNGVPNHAAWITGAKAVLAKFDAHIVMTESTAEPYLPYTDIAYITPPNTNQSNRVGLFGYLYGDVPGFHIAGMTSTGTETAAACAILRDRAKHEFLHDAVLFSVGFACDRYLGGTQP